MMLRISKALNASEVELLPGMALPSARAATMTLFPPFAFQPSDLQATLEIRSKEGLRV